MADRGPNKGNVIFQGIADPRCRCTPDEICALCRGKKKVSWNDAIKASKEKKKEDENDR
jgi:hypothetical protein